MTLTPNLIACLAIGGAGILTALLSIPFFQHTGMLRRKCSACTTGTVVRYFRRQVKLTLPTGITKA